MPDKKRGQISTEYIIIVSFVIFLVLSTLGIAFFYSSEIQNAIKFNQIENFAQKILTSSESVFYSGQPAKAEINGYLPRGINQIQVLGYEIVFNVTTPAGDAIVSFPSNVNLTGTVSTSSGVKKIFLDASADHVTVSG